MTWRYSHLACSNKEVRLGAWRLKGSLESVAQSPAKTATIELDRSEGSECLSEHAVIISNLQTVRKWRNWQTHQT